MRTNTRGFLFTPHRAAQHYSPPFPNLTEKERKREYRKFEDSIRYLVRAHKLRVSRPGKKGTFFWQADFEALFDAHSQGVVDWDGVVIKMGGKR